MPGPAEIAARTFVAAWQEPDEVDADGRIAVLSRFPVLRPRPEPRAL
jgi:hypothetical protein